MKQLRFKNVVSILLAISIFTSITLTPKRSDAALAGFGGGPVLIPLIVIGAAVGVGTAGSILSIKYFHTQLLKIVGTGGSVVVAVAGVVFGLVLLDDHGGSSSPFQYAPLTADQSVQLGITPQQGMQYENDLPQINAIAQQIIFDLVQNQMTSDTAETLQFVQEKWNDYGAMISPESMMIVRKIGEYTAAQASAQK